MILNELVSHIETKTGAKARQAGTGFLCRCPAHEDRKASLSVSAGSAGKLLLKCQAGCNTQAVVDSLGLKFKDLFPAENGAAKRTPEKKKIVATYDYTDARGKLLYQVVRFEPKDFRQRKPDESAKDGWSWKLAGVQRVVYRLPEIMDAVSRNETVYVCEGEKDVAAIVAQGLNATCNAGGAGKFPKDSYTVFKGAKVIIISDKDAPGRSHAAEIATKIKPLAKSVKVLELPDMAEKPVKDAADFFSAGGSKESFCEITEKAPEFALPGTSQNQNAPNGETPLFEFYYDKEKSNYWRKTPAGDFVRANETDLKRHCQLSGMAVRMFTGNFGLTQFDAAICEAQNNAAVDHVICLAGHKAGVFVTEDGRKILVPRGPRLVTPRKGDFPNFETLFIQLFGATQLPFIFAWLKVMLEDLYGLKPSAWRHNQLLALVGKPNCGKSFFQSLVTSLCGGRQTDPYLAMVGKSNFNEDIAESEHLMMEDKHALRDAKSRAAFGTSIKQLTVSSTTAIHGKGKKMFSAPSYRRMSISINEDADYITVLPMLDDSVADKMMLIKCGQAEMLPDWSANRERFNREMPALVYYLLNDFKIPENHQHQRFGVIAHHNSDVIEMLQQFEPHLHLLQILDATFFKDGETPLVRESAAEIQRQLSDGSHSTLARQLLGHSSACGQLLGKLAKEQPERFSKTVVKGIARWEIKSPKKSGNQK